MISCVDCGYESEDGLLHYDHCRLILLQWIHIEGKGHGVCEFSPLTDAELADLSMMEDQMKERGAILQPDGYFGKCVTTDTPAPKEAP